jgi:hypothetical protein
MTVSSLPLDTTDALRSASPWRVLGWSAADIDGLADQRARLVDHFPFAYEGIASAMLPWVVLLLGLSLPLLAVWLLLY